jgi:transcription-repair coupling factor (superfamily II helicase)
MRQSPKDRMNPGKSTRRSFWNWSILAFIPDEYITEATEKMEIYKSALPPSQQHEELASLNQEIYDRFGPLPDEVHSLLEPFGNQNCLQQSLKSAAFGNVRGFAGLSFSK